MALDEPRDQDEVYDIDGFQYLVDKNFLEKAKPIKVDYMVHGFKLDCGMEFNTGDGCAGCGSEGDTCG